MVNVPGRSKGCKTCRRRKKGCDSCKPTCQRCEREGYLCGGYDRSTIWVNYEPKKQRSPPSTSKATIGPQMQLVTFGSQEPNIPNHQHIPAVALSTGLIQTQLELQIVDQFLNIYIPKIPVSGINPPLAIGWRDAITRMSQKDSLMKRTMASLVLSCLGERMVDESLRKQGAKLYGVVLSQLNKLLEHPSDAVIDENVTAAISLMGIYEQFNGFSVASHNGQSRNWQSHIIGIGRLFELQGPLVFASEDAFAVFQSCQQVMFISACMLRRETFLASTQWRTVPWNGRRKDWRDRLFDVVFSLPGLVAEADKCLACRDKADASHSIKSLLAMSIALDLWKDSVQNECYTGLGQIVSTIGNTGGFGIRELEAPTFDSIELQTAMLFCAVKIHVLILLVELLALEPQNKNASASEYQLQAAISYAFWILEVIPVAIRDGGIIGSQSVLFPIGAISWLSKYLALPHPEVAGILVASVNGATRRMSYMRFLNSFLDDILTSQ